MFGSDSLDRRRSRPAPIHAMYEDALGAQLDLSLREGSRDPPAFRHRGRHDDGVRRRGPDRQRRAAARGSPACRNSYRSWPPGPHSTGHDPGFGFADLHAKLVYDVSPGQQVSVTGTRWPVDARHARRAAGDGRSPRAPTERACSPSAGGRRSPRIPSIRQRLFVVGQDLLGDAERRPDCGRRANRATRISRARRCIPMFGGLLEAGADDVPAVRRRHFEAGIPWCAGRVDPFARRG